MSPASLVPRWHCFSLEICCFSRRALPLLQVLDHVVIQRMDTSGRMVLDPRSNNQVRAGAALSLSFLSLRVCSRGLSMVAEEP